jgi:hypothetical protein
MHGQANLPAYFDTLVLYLRPVCRIWLLPIKVHFPSIINENFLIPSAALLCMPANFDAVLAAPVGACH